MATSVNDDSGFCLGGDYNEHEIHSSTDSSEDSVEVKVFTISYNQNKRKLEENAKTNEITFSGPLKKRMCMKMKAEALELPANLSKTPFRPWSPPKNSLAEVELPVQNVPVTFPTNTESSSLSSVKIEPDLNSFLYFRPPSPNKLPQKIEPISVAIKCENGDIASSNNTLNDIRVPIHPQVTQLTTTETERMILKTSEQFPVLLAHSPSSNSSYCNQDTYLSSKKSELKRDQRSYKNMTRERRIEANARERTRVHTISAAFDTLRRAVPSYSHNQKLSKLSVLRIACSYIMTLSSMVQDDNNTAEPLTLDYVDLVSKTIQREGKLKKKKDDND